jgi:metallo-beta-lactamase family protein
MIVLAGFQAAGTRGRLLLEGKKSLKIHGKEVAMNAEVELVDGFSAHADQNELLQWLKNFSAPPKSIFVTHGEPEASLALKNKIQAELNWNAVVPEYLQTVEL